MERKASKGAEKMTKKKRIRVEDAPSIKPRTIPGIGKAYTILIILLISLIYVLFFAWCLHL